MVYHKKNLISISSLKFKQGGGMERYLVDLVNGFHQINIIPKVYSTKFDTQLDEYQYINPIRINLSLVPKQVRQPFLSYFSNKQKEQNEISITMSYTNADIVICGGNHKGYLKTLGLRSNLKDLFKIHNEKKSLDNAKLIVAHSKLMKKELVELYNTNEEKITVIYPPIDTSKFLIIDDNKRKSLREKLGFKENEVIYLFPSTGHSRKGFDILKKYFEKSDLPIRLVVAGTPVTESKNITSLGFCKNMPELYQASDYTIMASNYEPFGLVGLESILSGTPIIFADNIGCLEILKNNFGYTFSRNNIETLDQAIKNSVESATCNVQHTKQKSHRIQAPLDCIDYDPRLSHHIQILLQAIANLK